jgi:protein-S-isoprenylcysteine O-methyltransferase Ste14
MPNKKIFPPTYLLMSIIVMIALHFLFPVATLIASPWTIFGIVPIGLGVTLNLVADRMFRQAKTTVKPLAESTVLVTGGVFRFSRNPMYVGFVLILGGIAVVMGSLTPFLAPLLFVCLMNRLFISPEERMLEAKFGQTYRDYKKQVRRWI